MTEKLLSEQIVGQVKEVFERLQEPVEILFFGQKDDCTTCDDTLQLLKEVTDISDKLSLTAFDIQTDEQLARQYRIDKTPGFVMLGKEADHHIDYGVRFSGIPAGHEFSTLIHDLVLVSGRDSQLSPIARNFLAGLKEPVLLQVFVTPT